jgi:hypothetical protein
MLAGEIFLVRGNYFGTKVLYNSKIFCLHEEFIESALIKFSNIVGGAGKTRNLMFLTSLTIAILIFYL